jgi:hypothetical protein
MGKLRAGIAKDEQAREEPEESQRQMENEIKIK